MEGGETRSTRPQGTDTQHSACIYSNVQPGEENHGTHTLLRRHMLFAWLVGEQFFSLSLVRKPPPGVPNGVSRAVENQFRFTYAFSLPTKGTSTCQARNAFLNDFVRRKSSPVGPRQTGKNNVPLLSYL